jgi:hypothetical protein
MSVTNARRGVTLLLAVGLLLTITSCGRDDDGEANTNLVEQDAAGADNGAQGQTDSDAAGVGDDASSGSSLGLPENLTIPTPDGGTVTGSVSDTGYANVSVEYSSDRYDEIVGFYTDWTASDSRDWLGGDSSYDSGGSTVRGYVWDSTASHIGVTDCAMGGSEAVCLQITDEG